VIRFVFNERKAAQAAAYVLKECGGRLEYIKLIKLLYLADRKVFAKLGRTITGDKLVSMEYGPVLSFVYELISSGPPRGRQSEWFQHVSPSEGYFVRLESNADDLDELSAFELSVLNAVIKNYGPMDKWDLIDNVMHKLPEWHDPGSSSSDIDPEEILKAEGWDDEAIKDVQISAIESRLIAFG
jgi:uncharacterized phage-associated protein